MKKKSAVTIITCLALFCSAQISNAQEKAEPPTLGVQIPGLEFATVLYPKGGFLDVPWLSQYIAAIAQYLFGISFVAAAIMIVYGGFLLIVGSATPAIKRGKEIIRDAILGLLILIGSYLILQVVNPETLTLAPLKIQSVMPEDLKFMLETAGMKNVEGAKDNETGAGQERISGSAPIIPPQIGENVKINNIDLSGKEGAPAQLFEYCGKVESSAGYDEKIQALVRVVLGFHKVCIDNKKCAYYRGGYTSIPSGKIESTLLDLPFAELKLSTFPGKKLEWDKECAQNWDIVKKYWYENPIKDADPVLYDSWEKKDKAYRKKGEKCYDYVVKLYEQEFKDRYEKNGIFGGDCGTTLITMYKCAGGEIARIGWSGNPTSPDAYTSGKIQKDAKKSRPQGKDVVVWAAKNEKDLMDQLNAAGGPKFGDIWSLGQENWAHNFMYTGGRDDVPFEFIEMGSSGADGLGGTKVLIPGFRGIPIGGMFAWPKETTPLKYIQIITEKGRRGKPIFPVFVSRPYDYERCTSKSECKDGEACHCTAGDGNENWAKNICGNANICHKVRTSFCTNDEHCPKGMSCNKKTEKSASGTCQANK